jgi:prophage regulatory protein
MNTSTNITILRIASVIQRTGLSKSSLYEKLNPSSEQFDPSFPKQIKLGHAAVGWVESELSAWIEARIAASRRVEEAKH